jgi:hypothetical protein
MHTLLQESSIKQRIQTLPCGFTQSIFASLALTKSTAGNAGRRNGQSTLHRVNKWVAASAKIQGFFEPSVQHFLITCGQASLHLLIDGWNSVQVHKSRY